jgi:predicted unusual protein kinase regulating ubiquinone biosynthesis (AarF/ABC1/UbiB family)
MESSLGLPPDTLLDVFDSFDTKPLASGSIAQVHKAILDGRIVVAKVRHPNVANLIDMDFRLMRIAHRRLSASVVMAACEGNGKTV